ncbi:MAG: hypothetical protein KF900_01110 [Bacteroidetes bacterium]|nr:hypothetical protein [Bacteroidota bacterium]
MTTITLKINERTKAGKAFLEFSKSFLQESKAVTVVEESPYKPEFVAKIRRAEKQKGIVVNPKDVWGSLGLK